MPEHSYEWRRESRFLVSTDQRLLQPAAVSAAMSCDWMYWCKPTSVEKLEKLLAKSFCFGLYDMSLDAKMPQQIGLARLVTDEQTFAWLTDVYVLPDYKGKGLGKWLISCVGEELEQWPDLRSLMFLADEGEAVNFYAKYLKTRVFPQEQKGLKVMHRWYAASPMAEKAREA